MTRFWRVHRNLEWAKEVRARSGLTTLEMQLADTVVELAQDALELAAFRMALMDNAADVLSSEEALTHGA